MYQIFETVEIINPIIDHLINECGLILYNNYIEAKKSIHNTQSMIMWQSGVINQTFLPKDNGETKYAILNKWSDEEEPHFKTIDNFTAKGVKILKPQTAPENLDDAKSMKSASSSKFSNSSRFKKSVSKVRLISKLGGGSSLQNISKPPITEQKEEEDPRKRVPEKMPDDYKPPTPDPIIERLRDQRELQHLDKIRENERMRKIREEQQEYEERKKEQQKQLRNKQYTYDYDGQIVFLTNKPIDLQVNEVLTSDCKTNIPLKMIKENTYQAETKPAKEGYTKHDDENRHLEKAQAVEYPKQPPLVEAMKPQVGVNIMFDNGYIKEGGEYKIVSKISKRQYEDLIEGQQQQAKKQQYEGDDEIVEDQDSMQKKLHLNAVNQDSQRNVKIQNEAKYLWMMEEEQLKKSHKSSSSESKQKIAQSDVLQSNKLSPKSLKKSKIQSFERINAYRKFEDFKERKDLKNSRLHKAVRDFDQKVITNPMWGYMEEKELPPPISTVYKMKHNTSTNMLPSSSSKQLFPRIQKK